MTVALYPSISTADQGLNQIDDYPGIENYCLIIRVDGFRILYRPYDAKTVLVSLSNRAVGELQVVRFSIFSCHLNLERLQGTINGSLELTIAREGQPTERRTIVLSDAIARLYPIQAY